MALRSERIWEHWCNKVVHFDVERAEEVADQMHEWNLTAGCSDMVYVYPCDVPLRDYDPPPHFHIGRKRGLYNAALGAQGLEAQAKAERTRQKRLEYYRRHQEAGERT